MKRFLKIVAILALFATALAYVAFRSLFFDPFEGARASIDPIVPSNVDLFLRRKDLERDFTPFPTLEFFPGLRLKDEWKAASRTPVFEDWRRKAGLEELFSRAEKIPDAIKPLDLMHDLAGREVVLAGRFRPNGKLGFAVVARGSFRAKFLAEAARFAPLRKLAGGAIESFSEEGGIETIQVQGAKWHLFRRADLLVAGDDLDLVKDMRRLADDGGVSLTDSPAYRATVLTESPVGRPIDFVLDVGDLCKNFKISVPEPLESDPLFLRFAKEMLQPEWFGQAVGRLALGSQIELSCRANVDFTKMRGVSGGLFAGTTATLADLHKYCGAVFPRQVCLAGYLRLDVKEFLRRIEGLLDKDTRELLNSVMPRLRGNEKSPAIQAKSLVELLDTLSSSLGSELVFAFEPDEPYHVPGTPDGEIQFPDKRLGPRVALVLPVSDLAAAQHLVELVVTALKNDHTTVAALWDWSYNNAPEKFQEIKLTRSDLPTISIGFLELVKKPCLVVTTTGAFLDEIVAQKLSYEHGVPSGLGNELPYKQASETASGFGQGFVYLSSTQMRRVLDDFCEVLAENATRPDWVRIRAELTKPTLARKHPDWVGKALNHDQEQQLDLDLDEEIGKRDQEWKHDVLPRATEEKRSNLGILELFRWAALAVRVNERDLELRLRVATPAAFPQ